MQRKIISKSEDETIKAGYDFAGSIDAGDIIGLEGNLGSGKTRFIKGICKYFGVKDVVNSPTFIIVNEYEGISPKTNQKILIHHFDLYRIKNINELETIGFYDYINNVSLILMEWPEIAEKIPGIKMRKVKFEFGENEFSRIIII